MQQASCLEGGPLLWIWPLYLHVNQKSDDDDDDDDIHSSKALTVGLFSAGNKTGETKMAEMCGISERETRGVHRSHVCS